MPLRVPMAAATHVVAFGALRRGDRELAERLWRRALGAAGSPFVAAHCLAGLSAAAIQAGRYREAGDLADRGLALVETLGHRRLTANLHNHAGIAARLAGDHARARCFYEAALAGYGGRSRSAAAVWHNLGGLAFAEGRLADAERLTTRAVRLNRFSPIRRAEDLGMLGAIVSEQGRLDEGERLLRDALATFERRYGSEHREIAYALGNLAEVRRRQGALDEAQGLAGHALAVGERALGPRHPELAPVLTTLAALDTSRAPELLARASAQAVSPLVAGRPAPN